MNFKRAQIIQNAYVAMITLVLGLAVAGAYLFEAGRISADRFMDQTIGGQHISVILSDTITIEQQKHIESTIREVDQKDEVLEIERILYLSSQEAARQFSQASRHNLSLDISLPASLEVDFSGGDLNLKNLCQKIALCSGVLSVVDDGPALMDRQKIEAKVADILFWVAIALGFVFWIVGYFVALGWFVSQITVGRYHALLLRGLQMGVYAGVAVGVVVVAGDAIGASLLSTWVLGVDRSLFVAAGVVLVGGLYGFSTALLARWTIK